MRHVADVPAGCCAGVLTVGSSVCHLRGGVNWRSRIRHMDEVTRACSKYGVRRGGEGVDAGGQGGRCRQRDRIRVARIAGIFGP